MTQKETILPVFTAFYHPKLSNSFNIVKNTNQNDFASFSENESNDFMRCILEVKKSLHVATYSW